LPKISIIVNTVPKERRMTLISTKTRNILCLTIVTFVFNILLGGNHIISVECVPPIPPFSYFNGYASNPGTVLFGVDENGDLFRRVGISPIQPEGTFWLPVPKAPKMISVDVGGPFGVVYGLKDNSTSGGFQPNVQSVYTGTWYNLYFGGLKQLSVGGPDSQVWGVNEFNQVFRRAGDFSPNFFSGTYWSIVGAFSASYTYVSVGGPNGDVWALGLFPIYGGKRVYYRSGVTSDNKSGDEWVKVSDSYYEGFTQISVGGGFYGALAPPPSPPPPSPPPSPPPGPSPPIATLVPFGDPPSPSILPVVWGVNSWGNVYSREGISASNPIGDEWKKVNTYGIKMQEVSVDGTGNVWALSTIPAIGGGFQVYYFQGTYWTPIAGGMASVSAF